MSYPKLSSGGGNKIVTDFRMVVVPGLGGSGPEHWESLWHKKYEHAQRLEDVNFDMPEKEECVDGLDKLIQTDTSKEVVLVGHSLGTMMIRHWVRERLARSAVTIRAAMLVAPGDPKNYPSEIQGFVPIPEDKLPFRSMVVGSSNDTWASIEWTRSIAAKWGAEFVDIGPHGHINTDAGFGEWRHGETLLQRLATQSA